MAINSVFTISPVVGTVTRSKATFYTLYKIRFLMLAIFCFGSLMSGYSYVQFSIISDVLKLYYGVDDMAASWTTTIFTIGFITGAIPGMWLFQRYGLRTTLLIGMFGTIAGYWLICGAIGRNRFWLVMLGQGVISLFQPAFFSASPFIAYKWFGEAEVSKACSIATLSNIIGSSVSSALIPSVITINQKTIAQIESQMYKLFLSQAVVFTAGTIFALIFFREKPTTPPSLSQAKIEEKSQIDGNSFQFRSLIEDTYELVKNRNFGLITISYSIMYALFTALLTLLNQIIIELYPKNGKDVGYLGLTFQLTGCFAMLFFGIILDRTRKYRLISLIVYFGMTLFIGIFSSTYTNGLATIYVIFTLCGLFCTCFFSVGMELAVEATYPIPDITSSTLIVCIANLGTLIIVQLIEWILTAYGIIDALHTCLMLSIIGFFTLSLAKINLNRLADNKQNVELRC